MNALHRKISDLTLGYLTLGAQTSPRDAIYAAAEVGFRAVGPRVSGRYPNDGWPSLDSDPSALVDLKQCAAGSNLIISSVTGYFMSPRAQLDHLLANVTAAVALGAPKIIQGCFDPDRERVVSMLRDYASVSQQAGVKIAIEFMPMSEIKTIQDGLDVIEASGAQNVGLLIDTLHLARSGANASDIVRLDPSRVFLTQLCDASRQLGTERTLFDEAMSGRMYIGDGKLDLADVVRALPPEAELELETPVVADASLSTVERARLAAEAAKRFFDRNFGD